MGTKDPNAAAAKWAARTQAAVQDYVAGVNAVTQPPGRAAAAQADTWAANVAAAKGKFARNVGAVTAEEWKAAATGKGAQRIPQGVTDAQSKVQSFMVTHLQIVERVRGSLPPRGSKEQNIQRAVQMMRGVMQAYGG
jgi:MoxR-like ATPase